MVFLHASLLLPLQLKNQIAVVGLVHTLGNCFTNLSLGAVAVSFTHTIKVGGG